MSWKPSANLETLRFRAKVLAQVREFFAQRGVLEVETPLLGTGNVPDPQVTGITVPSLDSDSGDRYLQTSPELAMKRLVTAFGVSCFQICKAFREGERGRHHNPEFTLLEWYRVGWDWQQLIAEVVELVGAVAIGTSRFPGGTIPTHKTTTYRNLFRSTLDLDPFQTSLEDLRARAEAMGAPQLDRDGTLAFLLTHAVEPGFDPDQILVVEGFPASQAALSRIVRDREGDQVAQRFEVYLGALEVANGYHELNDVHEQRRRFARDHAARLEAGLPSAGNQETLIGALEFGMPDCSGVALGLDRLILWLSRGATLDQVVTFR